MGLINNIALLLALGLLYDTLLHKRRRISTVGSPLLTGLFIGLLGLAIMMTPWTYVPGVVFDTRSVLLCVAGLFFGTIPTVVAVLVTALFRAYTGGVGMWTGIAVIFTSGAIGLIWRHYRGGKLSTISIWELYLFGLLVHATMLLWMLTLPRAAAFGVLSELGVPVIVLFPIATMLLGKLMSNRHAHEKVEEELRESQQELSEMFSMSLNMISIADINSSIFLKINPAFKRILGYDEGELLNRSFLDFIHPDDLESTQKVIRDQLLEGEYVINFANRFRCKDGSFRWLEWVLHPIPTRGITFSMAQDITLRKQSEDRLRESEERFRSIFNKSPMGIAVLNSKTGQFVQVNQKYSHIVGYSAEDMLNLGVQDLTHPEDLMEDLDNMKRLRANEIDLFSMEKRYICKGGTIRWVDLTVVPLWGKEKELGFHLAIVNDITDRKQDEVERQQLESQLRQNQKMESIGTLAGGVAHEINNPINGIMNYAQLIIDHPELNETVADYAGEIIHETRRIAEIVRNLLTFSRDEKERHSLANIEDIIQQTLSLINTVIRKDQITIHVDIDSDLPKLKCRSQQIQQVMMNIVLNARDALNEKYMNHTGPKEILVRSSLFHSNGRGWIRTTIEDFGAGVSKKVQDRIFDPFFTTKPKEKGTGLGLSISYGIVKEHNGELRLENKSGEPTRFHIELPVDNGWDLDKSESHESADQ